MKGTFSASRYVFESPDVYSWKDELQPALGCEYDRAVGYYVCKNREEVSLTVAGGLLRFRTAGGKEVRIPLATNLSAWALVERIEYVSTGVRDGEDLRLSSLGLSHLCHRRGGYPGEKSPRAGFDVFASALTPAEFVAKYGKSFEGESFTPEGEGGTWRSESGGGEWVVAVMPAAADGPHRGCELKPPAGSRSIMLHNSSK